MSIKQWRPRRCGPCGGYGTISKYSAADFEGAEECDHCGGKGEVWIHRSGAIAIWPGGPFVGRLTKNELLQAKGV